PILLATWVCLFLGVTHAAPALAEVEAIDPVGRPKKYEEGKAALCAVWFEDGSWHIRATKKKDDQRLAIKGTVTLQGGGKLTSGELVNAETGDKSDSGGKKKKKKQANDDDKITIHSDYEGFDFEFGNKTGSEGLDFKVSNGTKTITFKLLIAGDD